MATIFPTELSVLHVIVPVRGTTDGKTRLGVALDAEERQALVLGMLAQTLSVLADWPACRAIHVVTDDTDVLAVIQRTWPMVDRVVEPRGAGLNGALREGRSRAWAAGATAVLFLPTDLPLLTTAALDSLLGAADAAIAAGHGRPVVVLAPAEARLGTNALLLAPPDTIEPQFGEASIEAHLRAAAAADASVQLVADPGLGFDLDTPEDLELLDFARLLEIQRLGEAALANLPPLAQSEVG